MLKLNVKSGEQKIKYKQSSLGVKFLIEGKKLKDTLDSLEQIFNIKIPVASESILS